MTSILEQCRFEVIKSITSAISAAVRHVKKTHGANDPILPHLIVAALVDAILAETDGDAELRNRSAEVLLLYSDD